MRILQIETYGRGGLTHYAFNLARALAARGHDIQLVTTAAYELEGEPPNGLEIARIMGRWSHQSRLPGPLLTGLRRIEAIHDAFAVARFARSFAPDVIHIHCTHAALLPMLQRLRPVANRLGAALVATAHVVTPHEPIRFQDAIYGRIHSLPDLVIAHSEVDRQRLATEFGVGEDRSAIIPHGDYEFFEDADRPGPDRATIRRELGIADHEEVALFFGYIREYKGLDLLFDAWPAVQRERPSARLLVAGDPVKLPAQRRREFENRARELGAVSQFGYVPFGDVTRYFAAADLLVMPYRRISQSGVLFLALSLGVPIVATRVGALPEMLQDGDSAVLVAPESAIELAAGLTRVLGDDALRQRLADGGREVAANHSWPAIAERTEAAFTATCARIRKLRP